MSLATVAAWGGWVFVLFRVDPYEAGMLGLILFYLTLFIASVGTWSVLIVVFRTVFLKRNEVLIREARIAFRHSIMLSLVGAGGLWLAAQSSLRWWHLLLALVLLGGLEYVFLLLQEGKRN